jgi:hypothetical protein
MVEAKHGCRPTVWLNNTVGWWNLRRRNAMKENKNIWGEWYSFFGVNEINYY